ISRTRSDRLGPLVSTGPFAYVRNPLYLGNVAVWVGFAVSARLLWLAPIFLVLLGLEDHAIVRWEEPLLQARRGGEYRRYASRVPRWMGFRGTDHVDEETDRTSEDRSLTSAPRFSWGDTLFSERGTLIAIFAGFLLLWLKSSIR